MRCPKYIRDSLIKRAKCAMEFTAQDCIIRKFLERNNIKVEDYDISGGCESYVNPVDSSNRILEAILAKEDKI